jgi:hypothetical protein
VFGDRFGHRGRGRRAGENRQRERSVRRHPTRLVDGHRQACRRSLDHALKEGPIARANDAIMRAGARNRRWDRLAAAASRSGCCLRPRLDRSGSCGVPLVRFRDARVFVDPAARRTSPESSASTGLLAASMQAARRSFGDRQVPDQSEGGSCFRVGALLSRYADALGFPPGLDSARRATVLSTSRRIALALGRMKYQ